MTPQTRTIDGYIVEISPLPAFAALEHFTNLTSMLGPSVLSLLGKDEALAAALAASLRNVKGSDVSALMKALLATCVVTVNGQRIPLVPVFDTEMQGKLLTAFKIFGFAIEVNYGDFFVAAKGALGGLASAFKGKIAGAQAVASTPSGLPSVS